MKAEINEVTGIFQLPVEADFGEPHIHHLWCMVVNRHEAGAHLNAHKVKCARSDMSLVNTMCLLFHFSQNGLKPSQSMP